MDECKPLIAGIVLDSPFSSLNKLIMELVDQFTEGQGLTLVHFSAQPKPFWSHLTVSPCLIDWGNAPNVSHKMCLR